MVKNNKYVDLGMFGHWDRESLKDNVGTIWLDYEGKIYTGYEPLTLMMRSKLPEYPKKRMFFSRDYVEEIITYKLDLRKFVEAMAEANAIVEQLKSSKK